MATEAVAGSVRAGYNAPRLFALSCLSLATGALVFILWANISDPLMRQFQLSGAQMGTAMGVWAGGMAIAVFLGSTALDVLGIGRTLGLACLLQVAGVTIVLLTPALQASAAMSPFWVLIVGRTVLGLGHGLIEASINPLAATVYPDDKTHKLNVLHAWWPGGVAIGGLIGFGLGQMDVGWQLKYAVIYVPAIIYGAMLIGQRFPPTERKAAGVSSGEMWAEALRPLYIVWFCSMFFTATTELAPGQWVDAMLSRTTQMAAILLLVYVHAIMFVGRHFAGPLAQRLSPVGLMWVASLLAGLGLLALSYANTPGLAVFAATVWGLGICYMWPTMLGVTSERFPKGGAVLMGLTGSAGMISMLFIAPVMGSIYDYYTTSFLPQGLSLDQALQGAASNDLVKQQLDTAQREAAPYAFRWMSMVCIPVLLSFGIIWLRDKARGGYRAERLETVELGQADPGDFSAEAVLQAEADREAGD